MERKHVYLETPSGKVYPYASRESAYRHSQRLTTEPRVMDVWLNNRWYYLALGEVFIGSDGTLVQYAHGRYRSCVSVADLRSVL